jgi:hypothetical protein
MSVIEFHDEAKMMRTQWYNFATESYENISGLDISAERAHEFVPQDLATQGLLHAALLDASESEGDISVLDALILALEFVRRRAEMGMSVRESNASFN